MAGQLLQHLPHIAPGKQIGFDVKDDHWNGLTLS